MLFGSNMGMASTMSPEFDEKTLLPLQQITHPLLLFVFCDREPWNWLIDNH